jgi:NAD(P)-dependent dehydrogenase (short-subunit alcohol dehydrogenase family)
VALVTGAFSGIGKAATLALAAAGGRRFGGGRSPREEDRGLRPVGAGPMTPTTVAELAAP